MSICRPGANACSIGRALPTFDVLSLPVLEGAEDEEEGGASSSRNFAVTTTVGELYVKGRSLAKGYLNLRQQTKAAFIDHPVHGRVFKTGDLVEMVEDEYFCRGHADNMVKVNGYRVELGEVEAKLNLVPGVEKSAVVFFQNKLYAFIVPAKGGTTTPLDLPSVKAALTAVNLSYFAHPHVLEVISGESMPHTISGKIDRKQLRAKVEAAAAVTLAASQQLHTPSLLEEGETHDPGKAFAHAFALVLGVGKVEAHDDFFAHGGDSVSASRLIALLRKGGLIDKRIGIHHLYESPTPGQLASAAALAMQTFDHQRTNLHNVIDSGGEQGLGTPHPHLFIAVQVLVWTATVMLKGFVLFLHFYVLWIENVAFTFFNENSAYELARPSMFQLVRVICLQLSVAFASSFFNALMLLAIKWTVMGTYRPGTFVKWGSMHLRHWVVQHFSSVVPWRLLSFTPACASYLRWLGAKVEGRNHALYFEPSRGCGAHGFDLYTIGDAASINMGAYCSPVYFTAHAMVVGKGITLGPKTTLSVRSTVVGEATLREGSTLGYLSNLDVGGVIPVGELWVGSPALPSGRCSLGESNQGANEGAGGGFSSLTFFALQVFDILLGSFLVVSFLHVPRLIMLLTLPDEQLASVTQGVFAGYIAFSVAFLLMGQLVVSILMLKVTVLFFGRTCPGMYRRYSLNDFLLWHKQFWFQVPQLQLNSTSSLLGHFMKISGTPMGQGSQVSQFVGAVPDLIGIGSECFFANPVHIGVPLFSQGRVVVDRVQIGSGSLIGNNAVIPIGTSMPCNTLLGVCSAWWDGTEHDRVCGRTRQDQVDRSLTPPVSPTNTSPTSSVSNLSPASFVGPHLTREIGERGLRFRTLSPSVASSTPKTPRPFDFVSSCTPAAAKKREDAAGGTYLGCPRKRFALNVPLPYPRGTWTDRGLMSLNDVTVFLLPSFIWLTFVLTWIFLVIGVLDSSSRSFLSASLSAAALGIPLRLLWGVVAALIARLYLPDNTLSGLRPSQHSYHDPFIRRWRVYNKIMGVFVSPVLLRHMAGGPLINHVLRFITGMKVGSDALIASSSTFREHGMVRIGNGATINENCVLRTHTFEDWEHKVDAIKIGDSVTIFPSSTIMLGAELGDGSSVLANSLVMKGENVDTGFIIGGNPAQYMGVQMV